MTSKGLLEVTGSPGRQGAWTHTVALTLPDQVTLGSVLEGISGMNWFSFSTPPQHP